MKYADLHVHTIFSDGTFSPEEVVDCASKKGLSCIAICDHDCVDAISPSVEYSRNKNIEVIPAVELTVIEKGKEIHILGYFISWRKKWLANILTRVQKERVTRIDRMIEKLKKFNIKVDREKVLDIAGRKGSVGRLHLARALFETRVLSSVQEAFSRYIGDSGPCYVEDVGFSPKEAIDIIVKAQGVPVLAHPATIRDDFLVREFVEHGIRGIEVFHSDHSPSDTEKYKKMAEENNLLITGGSDCHGLGKGKVLLGNIKIPYAMVEKIREEALKIRMV